MTGRILFQTTARLHLRWCADVCVMFNTIHQLPAARSIPLAMPIHRLVFSGICAALGTVKLGGIPTRKKPAQASCGKCCSPWLALGCDSSLLLLFTKSRQALSGCPFPQRPLPTATERTHARRCRCGEVPPSSAGNQSAVGPITTHAGAVKARRGPVRCWFWGSRTHARPCRLVVAAVAHGGRHHQLLLLGGSGSSGGGLGLSLGGLLGGGGRALLQDDGVRVPQDLVV